MLCSVSPCSVVPALVEFTIQQQGKSFKNNQEHPTALATDKDAEKDRSDEPGNNGLLKIILLQIYVSGQE